MVDFFQLCGGVFCGVLFLCFWGWFFVGGWLVFFPLMLRSDFFLTVPSHCRSYSSYGALTSGMLNWCKYQMCVPVC